MKYRIINILAAAAAVLAGAACDKTKEQDFDPSDPSVWTIAVQPETQTLSAEKGSATFTFTAPDYWRVSSPVDWLTFEPESGKPGQVTLTVTASQNTGKERSALVTVSTKYNRGKFTISQASWPYSADTWVVTGTVAGGEAVGMEDQGDQLVWKAAALPYYEGDTFKFRMGTDEATSLGLDGALIPVEDAENTYKASLRKGGESLTLPESGYWDVTLDMSQADWTVTVALVDRFDWTIIGTVNESDWDQDFAMNPDADKLVWAVSKLPYHAQEVFKFRMDANDAFSLGLDGELTAVEGSEGTYTGSLKPDGENITLPGEGYWNLVLDVVDGTLTAVFAGEFPKPEPNPLPSNWEALWLNDGSFGEVSWNGIYRFGLEGHDGNNECAATFPQEVWDRIRNETVYVYVSGEYPSIRVTSGWWENSLPDVQPGNDLLTDNEAYTWILTLNLSGEEDLLSVIDDHHLLFTGSGFTVLGIYALKQDSGSGGDTIWINDDPSGHGSISWNGTYRFAPESNSTGEEIYAVPQDLWDRMKSEKFYLDAQIDNDGWYNLRITTGWWGTTYTGDDIGKGDGRIILNGDGTFTLELDLSDDPILETLDTQHLLFTGEGYTPLKLYFKGEGGGSGPEEIDIAAFTMYEDRSDYVSYPYNPSWSENTGKWRIMRGGNPAIETLGVTTDSKFIVYKEVGTTGQIQWSDPNWSSFADVSCNDWDGSAGTIVVPVTEEMLKCINGETTDGWSDTAIIIQGDGLTVNKIVLVL